MRIYRILLPGLIFGSMKSIPMSSMGVLTVTLQMSEISEKVYVLRTVLRTADYLTIIDDVHWETWPKEMGKSAHSHAELKL